MIREKIIKQNYAKEGKEKKIEKLSKIGKSDWNNIKIHYFYLFPHRKAHDINADINKKKKKKNSYKETTEQGREESKGQLFTQTVISPCKRYLAAVNIF